jgi:hypothetical protein
LEFSNNLLIFAPSNIYIFNMLGIDSPHVPIEGKFADEIRATIRRVSTGSLNEADKRRIRRSRKVLQKFDAVWK